jgi:hypothetical protein
MGHEKINAGRYCNSRFFFSYKLRQFILRYQHKQLLWCGQYWKLVLIPTHETKLLSGHVASGLS